MLPICRLRQVAIKVSSMARNADCSRTLQNHFSVLIWSSCAKAPVSQLVEETASKSVQCGFESHRGHRIDEQPWLEISSHGFFFETHLAHVPLRGSSVPCHPPDCRLSPRLRLFAHLVERIKGLSRNGLPRQAERNTVLPDDLPVERAGHAGQVKSKILHDVRSLFFRLTGCGLGLDRDLNAIIRIGVAGSALETLNAHGGDGRWTGSDRAT